MTRIFQLTKRFKLFFYFLIIIIAITVTILNHYGGFFLSLWENIVDTRAVKSDDKRIILKIPFYWSGDTPFRWSMKEGLLNDLVLQRLSSKITGGHGHILHGYVHFIQKHISKETLFENKEKHFSKSHTYLSQENISLNGAEGLGLIYKAPVSSEYEMPGDINVPFMIRELITFPEYNLVLIYYGKKEERPYLNEIFDGLIFSGN